MVEIERGVPIPPGRGRPPLDGVGIEVFRQMQPGDSIMVPLRGPGDTKARCRVRLDHLRLRMKPARFVVRWVDSGYRVWRLT